MFYWPLIDSKLQGDRGHAYSFPHHHQHGVQHLGKAQYIFTKWKTAALDNAIHEWDALWKLVQILEHIFECN